MNQKWERRKEVGGWGVNVIKNMSTNICLLLCNISLSFFVFIRVRYHGWMKSVELQQLTASEPLTLEQEYDMQRSWREDADSKSNEAMTPLQNICWRKKLSTIFEPHIPRTLRSVFKCCWMIPCCHRVHLHHPGQEALGGLWCRGGAVYDRRRQHLPDRPWGSFLGWAGDHDCRSTPTEICHQPSCLT